MSELTSKVRTESTTELAVVNAQNAVQIFTGGGLNGILDGIEVKVRAMELDGSTAKGRDEIRSVAYKVARTKTALDAEAKKLTEGWRTATSQVNSERKRAQERLDALAEEVRKPLTDFENKEKGRIAAHEAALAEWSSFAPVSPHATAEELTFYLQKFGGLHADRNWEEFSVRALKVRAEVTVALMNALKARTQFDADQAELERLRKEETERQIREREQRAAESARIEAERKAKELADAEARRVIEAAEREQARIKAAADRIRADHEREQKQAADNLKREQEARDFAERRVIEQAESAKKEQVRLAEFAEKARIKAEADLKWANEKARRDAEAAIAKERERVERQRKDAEVLQAKREADEKHRAKIRAEIAEDLFECSDGSGIFHAPLNAEEVLEAIMNGKIRHIKVIY